MKLVMHVIRVFVSTLREIFDESAYTRFLQRNQTESSPEAYAAFWRENESASAKRIKCC